MVRQSYPWREQLAFHAASIYSSIRSITKRRSAKATPTILSFRRQLPNNYINQAVTTSYHRTVWSSSTTVNKSNTKTHTHTHTVHGHRTTSPASVFSNLMLSSVLNTISAFCDDLRQASSSTQSVYTTQQMVNVCKLIAPHVGRGEERSTRAPLVCSQSPAIWLEFYVEPEVARHLTMQSAHARSTMLNRRCQCMSRLL